MVLLDIKYFPNPVMSICNAELMAIFYAVCFILSHVRDCTFLLCTDSLSALQSLHDIFSPNPISAEIRKLLHDNRNTINMSFLWVPSHVGIPGNEQADRLARETLYRNLPINKIPIQDYKHVLKKTILGTWHEEWNNLINNKLRLGRKINHGILPSA
uniref:RNase H type-1 domain-containing protein n=1 Tax=Cacopsylla melanoneura TaxID=428564 RepID=A0A8D8LL75_9HEMI